MTVTLAPAPDSRAPATVSGAEATERVAAVVPTVIAAVALATVALLDLAGIRLTEQAGLWVLGCAVAVGLPHGALDVHRLLLLSQRADPLGRGALYVGYAAAAGLVFACWLCLPATTLFALLAVAAAHFAQAERACGHSPASAAVLGTAAVVLPFATSGNRTRPILDELTGHKAGVVLGVADVVGVLIALGAASVVAHALWRRQWLRALDILLVVALLSAVPPLVAFGVYFAGRHTVQQSCALLSDAAVRLGITIREAAGMLARRAAAPTLVAVALVAAALWSCRFGLPATVIAALLAVTVPHGLASARAELSRKPSR